MRLFTCFQAWHGGCGAAPLGFPVAFASLHRDLDHRGYSDLASLLRGDFDAGALRQELSGELPPKPQVIWDVQTGHRRLRPAPEPPAAPPPRDPKAPTPQTPPVPEESVGAPGYKQGLKGACKEVYAFEKG